MIQAVLVPTSTLVTEQGVTFRVWRGHLVNGRPCRLLVAAVEFGDPRHLVEFERELQQLDDQRERIVRPR